MAPDSLTDTTQLYALAEELRQLCETRATGSLDDAQERRYASIRKTILFNNTTKDRAPGFLRDCRTAKDFWGFIQPKSPNYAGRRTFLREEFAPLLSFLEAGGAVGTVDASAAFLEKLDSEHVRRAWRAAVAKVETDPEGAITAARTLMETVCKHLMDDLKVPYTDKDDLPKLYKSAALALNLAPSQHSEEVFKQVLGGSTAIVEGLGAIRNRLSDAHGKGRRAVVPAARHAEWVVNLSLATSVFIVRTWEERHLPTSK